MLSDNQAEFRKRRSTVNNLYILNYKRNKTRKVIIIYPVCRHVGNIWYCGAEGHAKSVREKKVKQQIVKAIENIHKETKNTVAVNGEEIAKFWTTSGLTQDCSLSPVLLHMNIWT